MVQVALVLWGCGLALYPYPPDLTVHNAAASRRTLSLLLAALAAGAVILFPSLGYLYGSSRRTRSPNGLAAVAPPETAEAGASRTWAELKPLQSRNVRDASFKAEHRQSLCEHRSAMPEHLRATTPTRAVPLALARTIATPAAGEIM